MALHDGIADLATLRKYQKEGTQLYLPFVDGCVRVSTTGDGQYEVVTQHDRENDFLN